VLWIPEALWGTVHDALAEAPAGYERVAYLDGVRWRDRSGSTHAVVTTVTVPNATLRPRSYGVSASDMAEAGRHLHELGLVRLAQIHTHGTEDVGHSSWDDHKAYSQRDGAISIVLPRHAADRPWPDNGGVHLREPQGWRRLSAEEAAVAVRVVPSMFDNRRKMWSGSPIGTKETSEGDSDRSARRWGVPWRWWSRSRRQRA
jgi:hypothetical protein